MSVSKRRNKYTDGEKPTVNRIIQLMVKKKLEDKKDKGKDKKIKIGCPSTLDRLSSKELTYLSEGMQFLTEATKVGFEHVTDRIMTGKANVSKNSIYLLNSRDLIISTLNHLSYLLNYETESVEYMERLEKLKVLSELASEGMIIEKVEDQDGVLQEKVTSSKQVQDAYSDYSHYKDMLSDRAMTLILGLGMSCIGVLGALLEKDDNTPKKDKYNDFSIVTLTTVATAAIRIIQDVSFDKIHNKERRLRNDQNNLIFDFLYNQKISDADSKDQKVGIESIEDDRKEIVFSYQNNLYGLDVVLGVLKAVSSGIYINNHVKSEKNLSQALSKSVVDLMASKNQASNIIAAARMIPELRQLIKDFQIAKEKVERYEDIYHHYLQLVGAESGFNSFKITDFKGNFHPRNDEDTNKVNYLVKLDIDEFEAKKGDLILITGDSGSGKSTFLRFLKLGDFNKDNQQQIELDNGQTVDHLGNQFIYLNPEFSFTDEDSILLQMTGKSNVEDLTEDEKNRLLSVLDSLELKQQIYDKISNAKNIDGSNQLTDDAHVGEVVLDYLAKAVNQEFSLGQERRLALTKVFYRDLDPASVLLFDEPANNVEDELALKEFELMAEYAKKRDMILIFTTHNKAAQKIATKCYNMDNGVLRLANDKIKQRPEEPEL